MLLVRAGNTYPAEPTPSQPSPHPSPSLSSTPSPSPRQKAQIRRAQVSEKYRGG